MIKYYVTIGAFLMCLYGSFLYLSLQGWGYAGYSRSNYYRPSFWYFSSSTFYPNRDLRPGSIGGRGVRGGGPRGGK